VTEPESPPSLPEPAPEPLATRGPAEPFATAPALPEPLAAVPEPLAAPYPPAAPPPFAAAPEPEEPLLDPYLLPPPAPPAGLSRLALSALVAAFLGPVGAILAIVFGHYARREIERSGQRRHGYALATTGMVLGVVLTMLWGGMLSYLAWTVRYRVDPAGEEPGVAAPEPKAPPEPQPPHVGPPPEVGPFAPRYTKVNRIGGLTVTDLGSSSVSLGEELAKQRAEASTAGETMLVMTTANRCDPCRGVDLALGDARMQSALARVRLVRVDVHVFHEDLEQLKIPDDAIPGFFLLAPDLTPRDGVNGGEWDDDVPVNIAPVLGPFLRGQYAQRRIPWHPVPSSGMTL
jgi:hypothetical protein